MREAAEETQPKGYGYEFGGMAREEAEERESYIRRNIIH